MANNLSSNGATDATAEISYSISASIPLTYHTQLQSWFTTYGRIYDISELVHAVQQNMFIAAEYDFGESVWIAMDTFQLDQTANEDYELRSKREMKSSISECEEGTKMCKMEIKKRETKVFTLSIFSSFITGKYSVNIQEALGHQDTIHISKPVITLGDSYKHAPEESIIVTPGPPSDSGFLKQIGGKFISNEKWS